MQNRNTIIVAVVAVLLIVLGGAFYLKSRSSTPKASTAQDASQVQAIKLSPDDIGLDFHATPDKKYVKFVINKPNGIEHVDYDILYDALSNGETVQQGVTGEINKQDFGNGKIEINNRELGTCSTGGKCRFDEGVKTVNLVLRLLKTDGKTYEVDKSIDL